ncbi:RING finger protein [Gregarina niphandrodes]|uniref:RING finger protein n=1 Tax=Gregarina niphandrodes TaxID=110365 RepID=A0A023B384_GRENI|nr:RING finger protein [Gregarina niphandrodes]EZG55363.1 RING finger protein [Gregarina niphandrodes]|eukprot:XP_011131610.1 RING finger protein [Gregarina niphandrodes]
MHGAIIRDCDEILNELDEITHTTAAAEELEGILDGNLDIGIDWIGEICPWDGYDLGQNMCCEIDEEERAEDRLDRDTGEEDARDEDARGEDAQGGNENVRRRNGAEGEAGSECAAEPTTGVECPVCMCDMSGHEVSAMPASCSHRFCVECLTSWAEKCTSCPLCRVSFSGIKILTPEGPLLQRVRKRRLQEDDYESDVAVERPATRRRPPSRNGQCCVCSRALRRHFIECMRCGEKFHEECMSVRLTVLHEQPVCYRCESSVGVTSPESTNVVAVATSRRRRRRRAQN